MTCIMMSYQVESSSLNLMGFQRKFSTFFKDRLTSRELLKGEFLLLSGHILSLYNLKFHVE